ncbi:hypothetical protein AB0K53_16940 [Streptomyces tuirus]|uniref:hypothetical protein n=1 Tax=Streptomyces tuirus TaxID=68278 RepID=UPI00343A12B3
MDNRSAIVDVRPGGGHHWRSVVADGTGQRRHFDFGLKGANSVSVELRLSR